MKVIIAWLADFAWILYAACILGALIYVARALSLQRRLEASLTSFERETMAAQVARLWRIAFVFVIVGALLFVGQMYLLPRVVSQEPLATPTVTGLVMAPTSELLPTSMPVIGALPTITATLAAPSPPSPPPEATPTLEPSPTPEVGAAYSLGVRLGAVGRLEGYDLTAIEVTPAQSLGLTLYWRALEGTPAADYWVFVHLRSADGQLIAQHDSAPANGARPTTTWQPGDLIVDPHQLIFNEAGANYTGVAEIAVGLYNPAAPEERVPVEGGGDYAVLPTTISVVAP